MVCILSQQQPQRAVPTRNHNRLRSRDVLERLAWLPLLAEDQRDQNQARELLEASSGCLIEVKLYFNTLT